MLGDGLISEWLFENNIDNNIGGGTVLCEYSNLPLGELFNASNLYLYAGGNVLASGEIGKVHEGISLYIPNDQTTNPIPSGLMSLFIDSYYDRMNSSAKLFVKGNAFEGASDGKAGYTPTLQPINLYLFNNQSSTPINNYVGLFVHNDYSNNISMYTAGIIDIISSGISFFMSGTMPINQSATLFTHGF